VYPIPRIDDMLAQLGQCSYFSCFDLAKGYFQIKMKDEDKPKTAFISHKGMYQYKRMPMGMCNCSSTFQRCMEHVLAELIGICCSVYFDDVCVFSKTFEEHLEHIRLVLTCLQEAGFTINPSKIQLCRTRFRYLGFIIEPGKCFPDPEKVSCLVNYPRPEKPKDIQRFLGFVGFYRRFIPDFAKYAKPLSSLLKKGQKFTWSENAETGFNALKNALSDYTLLYLPDMNHEFTIQTDASDFSLGAILLQEIDGVRYPCWFASRTLRPAEINYSTTQKEILAVLWAIEKFRGFIEYSHFIIETDHQAISWLNGLKDPTGRLARWFIKLQMHDFEIRYRKGNSNVMKGPDALSRISHCMLSETKTFAALSRAEIIDAQDNDDALCSVKHYLKTGTLPDKNMQPALEKDIKHSALTDDQMLMRYVGCRGKPWEDERLYWRVWVPASHTHKIMKLFHESLLACHLGIRKTYKKLEERVYWKGLRADVQNYVNRCANCQRSKAARLPPVPATGFHADSPWSFLTIDLMGPYTKGSKQSTHLLLVVDHFTRYVELFPLKNTKAEKIVEKLWEVCLRWGLPYTILSDNGTQFTSKIYANWCSGLGIRPFYISPYHPQANLTERYCKTVKSMMISIIEQCRDWDKYLPELAFALHTSVSDATGFTPAYANFGRELRTPFDNHMQIEISKVKHLNDLSERLSIIHHVVQDELEKSQTKHLKYYNAKAKSRSYKLGDLVWLKTHFLSDASKGITASLLKKREGPYQVSNIIANNIYNLVQLETGAKVNKVHVNELSPYFPPCSDNGEERKATKAKVESLPEPANGESICTNVPNAHVSSGHVSMDGVSSQIQASKDSTGLGQSSGTH